MKHRIHTTSGGDKFLRSHIEDSTPWSREAYRPPARSGSPERSQQLIAMLLAGAGILGLLVIVAVVSK